MHVLLSQQLQVLESPQIVWRGEVWPGQVLEWLLRHETEHAQDHAAASIGDEADAGWESKLKLSLPQLGTVTVHIKLDTNQAFSIRMVPEQTEVEPLLRQNQGRLMEQLAAAGCTLRPDGATRCRRLTNNVPRPRSPTAMAMRRRAWSPRAAASWPTASSKKPAHRAYTFTNRASCWRC
jgi:hypothetical protein